MTINIYRPTAEDGLSLAELALYHDIIDHRAGLGLPALPLSRALTITAGRHVADTRENIWADRLSLPAGANLHSWSDAPYFADGRSPEVMWEAPQRLGTGYRSAGYEITAAGYVNAAAALEGWKVSPPHRAILDNSGTWADNTFAAIGVGLSTAPGAGPYAGRIYNVWFGETADASGPPLISGTARADRVLATSFADVVSGLGGADSITGGGGADQLSGGTGGDRLGGGSGNDFLSGAAGADFLLGGLGNDLLVGASASDRLTGNGGNDILIGGTGRDVMIGGTGGDFFRFRTPGEAGVGAGRDVIADFQPRIDHIDLRQIDARPDLAGNQAFVFGGSTPTPGSLHVGGGVVSADLDGDGVPDFQLGFSGAPTLSAGDFLL